MNYRLVQSQTQKLTVTSQMQQSLYILQSSYVDLVEFVNQQLNENPVLEGDMEPYLNRRSRVMRAAVVSGDDPIARVTNAPPTLEEHLLGQLNCIAHIPAPAYAAARYIIGNLDANGYLTLDLNEIVSNLRLSLAIVERGLALVQGLDPAGVGARNMKECLLMQLGQLGHKPDSLTYRLADRYLDALAERRFKQIAKQLKVSLSDVQEAAGLLTTLSPRPGAQFHHETADYVMPDVIIAQEDEGRLVTYVYNSLSRAVSVSGFYRRVMEKMATGNEEYNYLKEKLLSAQWLMKCLSKREQTLRLVTEVIVEVQSAFFRSGAGSLVPLTLKEIAQRTGMHESTVSRAVAGKYAQTPRGVIKLKSFFTNGIHTTEEGVCSADRVKDLLKKLIQAEAPAKPFTDQELAEMLQQSGVRISRRTVAKYREEIGIVTSSRRAVR